MPALTPDAHLPAPERLIRRIHGLGALRSQGVGRDALGQEWDGIFKGIEQLRAGDFTSSDQATRFCHACFGEGFVWEACQGLIFDLMPQVDLSFGRAEPWEMLTRLSPSEMPWPQSTEQDNEDMGWGSEAFARALRLCPTPEPWELRAMLLCAERVKPGDLGVSVFAELARDWLAPLGQINDPLTAQQAFALAPGDPSVRAALEGAPRWKLLALHGPGSYRGALSALHAIKAEIDWGAPDGSQKSLGRAWMDQLASIPASNGYARARHAGGAQSALRTLRQSGLRAALNATDALSEERGGLARSALEALDGLGARGQNLGALLQQELLELSVEAPAARAPGSKRV